jgi:hypothetical protein
MASRINGIVLLVRRPRAQRVARFAQPSPVLGAPVDRAAPIQRLVLGVTFAKLEGDFGLRQLSAQIKRVRAIRFDPELIEQRKSLPSDKMAGAVVDVNSVFSRLDPLVVVLHLR